jgi:hypothetical protein
LAEIVENPYYVVTSRKVGKCIQCISYHAPIYKFLGLWPFEESLKWWVNSKWKVKGAREFMIGYKGFFTTIFNIKKEQNIYLRMIIY